MKKWLFLFFLVGAVIFTIKIYRIFSESIWNGEGRINLIFKEEEKIFVFSLDLPEKRIIFLSFPSETLVKVIHGYGFYQLGAVYKLGEIENKNGEKLLVSTLQENLKIPIDGYGLVLKNNAFGEKDKQINIKTRILNYLKFLLRNGKTNLTKWDLLRLWWQTKKIRQDKILVVETEKTDFLEETKLADGSRGFKIIPERIEKFAEIFFKDSLIRLENLTIAVLNSTNHQGLASGVAKLINNIGGRVIEVGETEEGNLKIKNGKCEIRSMVANKKSYTFWKLMRIFDCHWGGEEMGEARAEIVLILGEEYWKKLEEKW